MKLTNKEHDDIIHDPYSYVIKYVTPYGHGEITVKKSFWEKCHKKFSKALKDATIISLVEVQDDNC